MSLNFLGKCDDAVHLDTDAAQPIIPMYVATLNSPCEDDNYIHHDPEDYIEAPMIANQDEAQTKEKKETSPRANFS